MPGGWSGYVQAARATGAARPAAVVLLELLAVLHAGAVIEVLAVRHAVVLAHAVVRSARLPCISCWGCQPCLPSCPGESGGGVSSGGICSSGDSSCICTISSDVNASSIISGGSCCGMNCGIGCENDGTGHHLRLRLLLGRRGRVLRRRRRYCGIICGGGGAVLRRWWRGELGLLRWGHELGLGRGNWAWGGGAN